MPTKKIDVFVATDKCIIPQGSELVLAVPNASVNELYAPPLGGVPCTFVVVLKLQTRAPVVVPVFATNTASPHMSQSPAVSVIVATVFAVLLTRDTAEPAGIFCSSISPTTPALAASPAVDPRIPLVVGENAIEEKVCVADHV